MNDFLVFRSVNIITAKYYWICIDSGNKNENNLRSQAISLEKYFKRLLPDIFKEASVKTKKDFEIEFDEYILANP